MFFAMLRFVARTRPGEIGGCVGEHVVELPGYHTGHSGSEGWPGCERTKDSVGRFLGRFRYRFEFNKRVHLGGIGVLDGSFARHQAVPVLVNHCGLSVGSRYAL